MNISAKVEGDDIPFPVAARAKRTLRWHRSRAMQNAKEFSALLIVFFVRRRLRASKQRFPLHLPERDGRRTDATISRNIKEPPRKHEYRDGLGRA